MGTPVRLVPEEWISVYHHNIEECRSTELAATEDPRIGRLVSTMLRMSNGEGPNFGCLNEIQYDFQHVPTGQYTSVATNVTKFLSRIGNGVRWWNEICFAQGNCGTGGRARKIEGTKDYLNERNAPTAKKLQYGDPINCLATLPGQYGVGFWSTRQCRMIHLVSKLTWKAFNPSIDLSIYRDAKGDPLPADMPLFDKALMLMEADISGTKVYFVALHAMPAFGFGQKDSSNIARNGDQLAFLEWLLTGETYFTPPASLLADSGQPVHPLPADARVLAMGDFNADYRNKELPGAQRIRSLIKAHNFFPNGETTQRSTRPDGTSLELQLDYMMWRGLTLVDNSAKIGPIDPGNLSDHGALFARFKVPIPDTEISTWQAVKNYLMNWWYGTQ